MIIREALIQGIQNGAPNLAPENAGLRQPGASEGMIVVDLSLQPVALDRGGEAILNQLNEEVSDKSSPFRLPPEILETLRAGAPSELTATTMRVCASDTQYSCRVFLMKPQNGTIGESLVAIHLKREKSVGEAVRGVGCAYHLTAREQEAVIGISMGLTSRQVADRMNISPNTVNAFLRLIMVKMGVTTRAGVVGKLLNGKGPQVNGESKAPRQLSAAGRR
jgi:DNA-binding CsgD family transcriptional regulator